MRNELTHRDTSPSIDSREDFILKTFKIRHKIKVALNVTRTEANVAVEIELSVKPLR